MGRDALCALALRRPRPPEQTLAVLPMPSRILTPILLLVIVSAGNADQYEDLRINEILACNTHAVMRPDRSGFEDWIEIYNAGSRAVDLGGLFLTDDASDPRKWEIPFGLVVPSRQFLLLWADGRSDGVHASFRLDRDGEHLGLYRADGAAIDTVRFREQLCDISYGRYPDGGASWFHTAQVTPGEPNAAAGRAESVRSHAPMFSPTGGRYSGPRRVELSSGPEATIFFSLDGSIPSERSHAYRGPIDLAESGVVRAFAMEPDRLPSAIISHTYILNDPTELPVVAIATNPAFLFDEEIGIATGICVGNELTADPPFDPRANFWHEWERPVSLEYYEPDGSPGFRLDAGIRIFGGAFGRQIPQKAFTVFARNKYGTSEIEYPLFSSRPDANRFRRFLLRASSNDYNQTFFRDALFNTLTIGQMDIDYQAYEPVVVYINGTFWGIYNIREKTNQYYAESNYGIDADEVDLLEGPGHVATGSADHYEDLVQFVQTHDLARSSNYAHVREQMDVTEYMNYFITQLFVRNHDWLHQNIKFWRPQGGTGRWRWLLYDTDWGFGGEVRQGPGQYRSNSIHWATQQGHASVLFNALLTSPAFVNEFAQRFATHLSTTFAHDRVNRIITGIMQRIAPDMPRHIDRWEAIPSMPYWEQQTELLRDFSRERPDHVFGHLRETLDLDGTATLIAEVSDPRAGSIRVHGVTMPGPVHQGRWFTGIPLPITAVPNYGYRFVSWEGHFASRSRGQSIVLSGPSRVVAVFESHEPLPLVISEIHYNPSPRQGADVDFEFVELVNASSQAIDVSGAFFSSGVRFAFAPSTALAPQEKVVVARNRSSYAEQGFRVFQMEGGRLANEGDELILCDADSSVVDSVQYSDDSPWPEAPDAGGPSLELIGAGLDNALSESWRASRETGGTPGRGNSYGTAVESQNPFPRGFRVLANYPNPFNSGTTISFELPETAHVEVEIVNLLGQRVLPLVNETLPPGAHRFAWSGEDRSGQRVQAGVYLCRVASKFGSQVRKMLLID